MLDIDQISTIGVLIVSILSFILPYTKGKVFTNKYRNFFYSDLLLTINKKNIWKEFRKLIGFRSKYAITASILFFIIEFFLIVSMEIYTFFGIVIAIPILITAYQLKIFGGRKYILLDSLFDSSKKLSKAERFGATMYGFFVYLFLWNALTLFFIVSDLNQSIITLEDISIAVSVFFIAPPAIVLLVMQSTLRFDYFDVIKRVPKYYDIDLRIWVNTSQYETVLVDGEAIFLYPYLKIFQTENKTAHLAIIRWGDVANLSFSTLPKKHSNLKD